MATNATNAAGYTLEYTTVGGSSFTAIAQIEELEPPELEAEDIEVKTNASPSTHKEFFAGWADGGEASATLVFTKAQAATVYGLFRQRKDFKLTAADGSSLAFTGYIKGIGLPMDIDNVIKQTVKVKASGQLTFTAAA